MFTTPEIVTLLAIGTLGHLMASFWYLADKNKLKICERKIYDLPISKKQISRELKNSVHAPIHAVIFAVFLYLGFFKNTSLPSFFFSAAATTIWAEVWHYGSHRAFHLKALHWIHLEHHKSHLNSPLTAVSFSFAEKLVFNIGLLGPLAVVDGFFALNAFGIAAWYIGYLIINSFSHANFELKSKDYNRGMGKVISSTTYHSLHHSRYTGNYGLGTRILDRLFKTEWDDYELLYDRISRDRRPLSKLRETAAPHASSSRVADNGGTPRASSEAVESSSGDVRGVHRAT
jgi:sterol desaturase/sphingolipid hydroxylase (fatty acid hydroxylase superfamily)